MTERLSQLMHEHADGLDVPTPPTTDVLIRGRRIRRNRTVARGLAAVTAVAVLGGAALALGGSSDDGAARDPGPADAPAGDVGAAFAIDHTVHLSGGRVSAPIDDRAVKSLYYTSAGLVVRHGNNAYSDGGGPQRFSLVSPDGDVTRLSVVTEEVVHASDPTQPYLAWAEPAPGGIDVVVHDVGTDTEEARVHVDGSFDFVPASLSGDHVYVGHGDEVIDVDWRTGAVGVSDVLSSSTVAGGHAVAADGPTREVVDATTGDPLLRVDLDPDAYGYFTLSPDGRFAVLAVEEDLLNPSDEPSVDVYDVDAGSYVTLRGRAYDYGWSSDGELFRVGGDGTVSTCAPTTGECTSERPDLLLPRNAEIRLGGVEYES